MSLRCNTQWPGYCINLPWSPTLLKSIKTNEQNSDGSPLCPGSTLISNCKCGAVLLVCNGITSSFFYCARYPGICAYKEAYSIECCVAGRAEEPKCTEWDSKDAVGSAGTVGFLV